MIATNLMVSPAIIVATLAFLTSIVTLANSTIPLVDRLLKKP